MLAPGSMPAAVAGIGSTAVTGAAAASNIVIASVSGSARFMDHLPVLRASQIATPAAATYAETIRILRLSRATAGQQSNFWSCGRACFAGQFRRFGRGRGRDLRIEIG